MNGSGRVDETELARRFEEHRPRLRQIAYRMLGSLSETDDAVQETWLRLSRTDASELENLGAWLTTVASRVCLNILRSRQARGEQLLDVHMPDPIVSRAEGTDPESEALLGDSVGLAMLVVLDTLVPAERVAFVLHDAFGVPFAEIAAVLDATPAAVRQLASRARRRVRDGAPDPDADPGRQRKVVDAFFAASRAGDFDALVAVLAPDIVIRSDGGAARPSVTGILRGARTVAAQALTYGRLAPFVQAVRINAAAGVVAMYHGRPMSIMAFTVVDDRIVAIDVLADPDRLQALPGIVVP